MHDYFINTSNYESKNECIDKMNHFFRKVEEIKQIGDRCIEEYDNVRLQKDQFQRFMEEKEIIAGKILSEMGNQKFPPLECAECDL